MNLRSVVAAAVVALVTVACGPPDRRDPSIDGTWVGTIITEGNVTTVVNESGSVWGGAATLVEEMSIGVEAGAEEYMFGEIGGVVATEQHIYVVDRQLPRVRQYTLDGRHVRDLGGEGQGPGEYVDPGAIMADDHGRIFVQAPRSRRFNVYSEDGRVLDTWPAPGFVCCKDPMVALRNGDLLAIVWSGSELPRREGVQAHGPDGPYGAVRVPELTPFEPATTELDLGNGNVQSVLVPFSPLQLFTLAPSGAMVVGAGDRYRFEVRSPGGSDLVVERYWSPTPVATDEAEWSRRQYVARMRDSVPGFVWDGAEMPATKPAMRELVPQPGGEVLVVRQGPGERAEECIEDPLQAGTEETRAKPCWREDSIWDAFSAEGRYLGEVEGFPPLVGFARATVFKRGDMIVAATEDAAGTIMVKRYRLTLPRVTRWTPEEKEA